MMPKIPTKQQREVAEALVRWAEFEDPKEWTRTKRGNLTRVYDGSRVTVFKQPDESFGWCISSNEDETTFGEGYENSEDAMTALGEALGVSP